MVGWNGLYQFPNLLQSAREQLKLSIIVNTIFVVGSIPMPTAFSQDFVSPSVNRINPSVSHVNTLCNSPLALATCQSKLGHHSGDTMKL